MYVWIYLCNYVHTLKCPVHVQICHMWRMSYVLVMRALGAGAVIRSSGFWWLGGRSFSLAPSVLAMWLQRYFPDHSHLNSLFLGCVRSLQMFVLDLHLFCSPVLPCPLGSSVSPSFTTLLLLLCVGVVANYQFISNMSNFVLALIVLHSIFHYLYIFIIIIHSFIFSNFFILGGMVV